MSLNITSEGSPTPRKSAARFSVAEDLRVDTSPEVLGLAGAKRPGSTSYDAPAPLGTSTRSNRVMPQPPQPKLTATQGLEGYKKPKVESAHEDQASVVDSLLQRLSEQSSPYDQQNGPAVSAAEMENAKHHGMRDFDNSSNGSVPITPATDNFVTTPATEPDSHPIVVDAAELQHLKRELENARNEVNRMNQELHTSHLTKSTLDQTVGQSSEADYNYFKGEVTEQTISQLQNKFNAATRPGYGRQESWPLPEDGLSDKSDNISNKGLAGQAIWGNGMRQPTAVNAPSGQQQQPNVNGTNAWNSDTSRSFYGNMSGASMNPSPMGFGPIQPQPRPSTAQSGFRGRGFLNEPTHFPLDQSYRSAMNSNPPTRPGSAFDAHRYGQFPGFTNGAGGMSPTLAPLSMTPMGMYGSGNTVTPYQTRLSGGYANRLSPEAAEFSVDSKFAVDGMAPTPWNAQVDQPSHESSMQYVTPVEPMNYRRLLDRNMNCNWKYIVDKIICNNDQQASIFLQQKLKVGTAEQKYEIVDAIIQQAYQLMVNRFGNFLVQRCFEHGTQDQVIQIAQAIRGNTLNLSMDAFGCHVIQKAFDAVPEEYKATMVHELLRRIPETIIHRYACHVWQKLFELRWSDSPPQIMRYVNEALRGMWHEVALGETGSLVVQNIFENCLEEDKRPCIEEVLAGIHVISHGQFGNWCIQHICEHGAPADRCRAVDHIIQFASEYSMDQYASKVIEKCLKIGGNEFLDRYLDRVCEGRPDRPRMPLIDIAGDQFGNYLIQWILSSASPLHRDTVASHVRKHMVSLRGSKYGSRVAMLCCNPALATRPGPPAGMQVNRYSAHNLHRGGAGGASYGSFR